MAASSAILVENVVKTYGSKVILDELSINVERGTIYGLLGASGCGKTTLLSCIVGRKSTNSGEIWVLGGRPGEKGSGVPGPKIGYMPQELALVEEFTVKDAIYYFGTIYKMEAKDIKERFEYLSKLLELPDGSKFLKHCSGGQKRRVSFAAALVHSPELLILDEPTVGVDPILREKIWDHLKDTVNTKRTTVIITTHYIEEAKEANTVGFMRKGKIMIQETPNKLLATFQTNTLEEAFFILSQKQNDQLNNTKAIGGTDQGSTSTSVESFPANYGSKDALGISSAKERRSKKEQSVYMSGTAIDPKRMKALLSKNWTQFYRNIGGVLFLLTFPLLQMWFFANSVGTDPKHLKLGIVNNESMTTLCADFDWNSTAIQTEDYECHFRNLTCRFLTYLEHPMISKVLYKSYPEAVEGIKHGQIVGFLYIPTNFSQSFEERTRLGLNSPEWIVHYGEIRGYMDMSNRFTGAALAIKLYRLFIEFQDKLLSDCKLPQKFAHIPIDENFFFGNDHTPYTTFVTPGIALLLVFLLGSTMTSQIIVKEKIDGVWDRSIVAGVSSLEITLSHLSLQFIIMLVECAEVLLMIWLMSTYPIQGSWILFFFILYLEGVCGMTYGFFVSTFCQKLGEANIFCTGGYLPLTIICGIIWPIEAMPTILRWLSLASPCTMPILSLRNVMMKGWNLWNIQVINGIGVLLAWIVLFGIASVWCIKIRR
ncbi:ABC transporter G family member 23 [Dendroctonus ponderosae]|uniref:ABC transporter G family member 23 n=1 Tax=Dendroctonus ponderosae TaxID=77166 RepID=UPI0020363314|nr:ABC transporter G family member 23 [Dendroctonus ponderosae]